MLVTDETRHTIATFYIAVVLRLGSSVMATMTAASATSGSNTFMTMWTQGQVYVLNAGQSIELDCEFYAETYNMFKNPVVWRKNQRQELTELNIMGNILPPFLNTGRFIVSFITSPPRYRMRLKITDLSLEDSGNYSCEVRGPRANTLGSVTHYIFIRAPVQSVYFVTSNSSTNIQRVQSSPSHPTGRSVIPPIPLPANDRPYSILASNVIELTVLAGVPDTLRCVAVGGYPPPEIVVHMSPHGSGEDSDDITERLPTVGHSATLIGDPGLRVMLYRTERSADSLVMSAEDDGKMITCVASVADIGSVTASARLVVHHPPMVRCLPSSADLDDRNVFIQCVVRARPSLTSLYWQIDVNGTKVAEGTVKDEYWTLVMVRNDGVIETRLFMRRATAASFRQYTLFAENSVAVSRTETELTRRRFGGGKLSSLDLYRYHEHDYDKSHHQQQQHRTVYGLRPPNSAVVNRVSDQHDYDNNARVGGDVIRRMAAAAASSSTSQFASVSVTSLISSASLLMMLLCLWRVVHLPEESDGR